MYTTQGFERLLFDCSLYPGSRDLSFAVWLSFQPSEFDHNHCLSWQPDYTRTVYKKEAREAGTEAERRWIGGNIVECVRELES